MLNLHTLKPKIKRKGRKRVGRGLGSGHGAFSGRGIKGQKARKSGGQKAGFEGGRMPFVRQLPKAKGFRSFFPKDQVVKMADIERLYKATDLVVSPQTLFAKGLIESASRPVKVLSGVKISKALQFKEIKLSASARAAVEAAGGTLPNVQ